MGKPNLHFECTDSMSMATFELAQNCHHRAPLTATARSHISVRGVVAGGRLS